MAKQKKSYGSHVYFPIEYQTLFWTNGDSGVTNEAGMTDEKLSWLNGGVLFCVDEQFAVDQTVILVSVEGYATDPAHNLLEHLPFPFVKGFLFRRIPVELAVSCGNKSKSCWRVVKLFQTWVAIPWPTAR
ncbi:hypothetical protein N7447_001953 [Penicillium robsamsonii]|uniref:uncharacterized protein n=1 Tax=Penicillium robsamsonii TaxID=1792511 RepID=UPI0025478FA4|nr:uncharacterized protein N7447_001953 [Penicillium robsamsonii]KAJ5835927.1 hypothetical protein N7447_001953 [Penicillium robsamsonii]